MAAGNRSERFAYVLDRQHWLARAMIAPAFIYIVALIGGPFFLALYYSFTDTTVGSESFNFVGLKNFRAIVEIPAFRVALTNSFIFTIVSQAIVLILANILALMLVKDFWGKWIVRALIILPWVAPISLGSIGWLWILDSIYSIINWSLQALGIFGPETWPVWLGIPRLAMSSVIVVHVWRLLPLATVILIAGLTSIPQEIHDAAAVDGAGFWRQHFEITLPMVFPIMGVALLFGVVFAFTDTIVIYVLTRGGPFDSTQVLASLAFFTGIDGGDLAEGAAIALFLFPLLVAAAFFMLKFVRRSEVT